MRYAWLVAGQGKPTEAQQKVADAARDLRLAPGWHPLRSAFQEDWDYLDPRAQAALLDAWRALCEGQDLSEIVKREGPAVELRGQQIASNLARALEAPLKILELNLRFLPDRSTYLVLACEALRLYATDVRRAEEEYDREEESWRTAWDDDALEEPDEDG